MATFNGGSGNDHINGTNSGDTINGNGGNDTLDGRGGNDIINGGAGNDTIFGGTGDDTLHGNADNDEIHGGDNNDTIFGDDGNDNLFGDSGIDTISGGNGNDQIDGGTGNDILHGNANDDTVNGGDGDDTITGDDGNDTLSGGNNNDNVNGGSGNDIISGDDGNDTLTGGGGLDLIYGGNGVDTAIYSGAIAEYQFYQLGPLLGVVHNGGAGADGADLLLSVEKLQFSDVTIDLTHNNAPIAVDDAAATNEDAGTYSSGTASVLDNDFDFEHDPLHVTSGVFAGIYGTLTLNSNGTYTYVLNANAQTLAQGQIGTDTFSYTVSDGSLTDTGNLVISVTGINDAPVAHSDTAAGTENQILTINVLANDTDVDNGHVLTVVSASAPAGQGSASVVGNQVRFDPGTDFDHLAAGATQIVTLNYTITDEFGATSASTVAVTVTGTNDAPVAHADTASGTENQVLLVDVLANDTDVDDGHTLTVTSASAPSGQGSASIVSNKVQFNPGTDFDHLAQGATQIVTVNYTMQDENGASSSSTLTITVTGTNDAPVAVADSAAGTENQVLTINVLANDTDVDDGHVLTVTSASAPSGQGTATVVGNQVQFNPGSDFDHLAAGATQVVTVNYAIQDEHGATSASTIAITVTGTNDGPVANPDTASGTENQVLTIDVLANDTDVDDGHTLTVTSASAPSGQGTATVVGNQVQFNPGTDFDHLAAGATQVVTVSYAIQDEHGASSASTVTITVTGTNDAPVANADTAAGTENQTLLIDVLANDTDVDDGHVLTVTSASAPSGQGTATVVGNQVQFNPGTDFDHLAQGATQVVTVNYSIQDEHGATASSTIAITVTGTNDAPVAVADTASGTENQVLLVDVLANDTDVDDGHTLTVTSASAPSGQGTASVVSNQVQFDPGTDFDHLAQGATATVVVNYTMQDEHGASSASTVTITVTGTNDAPVANADTASGTENQTLLIDVLANDTDVDDGHVLTVTSASAPSGQGSASVVGNQVQFNPGTDFDHLAAGATQIVTVNYAIQDEHGATSASTIAITVTGTNDGPVANPDTASGTENQTLLIDVLVNDTDVDDGHALTVTSATVPAGQGSASVVSNQVQFDPGTDFDHLAVGETQVVTVNYSIQDEHGAPSASTVTITVTGTNDAPTINAGGTDDSGSVTELPNNDPGENVTVHHSDGTIAFADVDTSDVHSASATPQGGGYLGSFTLDPVNQPGDTVAWHFSVSDAALDSLNAGDTLTQVYTVEIDDGHGGTVDQDVTITIHGAADNVPPDGTNWYIDNSAVGSANDGSIDDPFTSIAAFNAAQGTLGGPGINDNVFLLSGTGTGVYAESDGINLLNGQVLTGVPTGLVRPTIVATSGDGINVAQGNNVAHIDIGNTSGAGIADSGGTVGTLTVSDVAKSGTGQIADLDQGGTLNVTLNGATSLGSSGGAIDLNAVGGSFTVSGATTITGVQSGGGIDITGSSLTASFSGGGTVSTAGTTAINFVGNTGALALNGGFVIATTSGIGLNATGGGTVTVQGSGNSVTSVSATAVNISGVTIGVAGATFHDISSGNNTAAADPSVGISLVNTGSVGFFHVTGGSSTAQGGDASGGTIQNIAGASGTTADDGASNGIGIGVYLNNAFNVTLDRMHINDASNFAVEAENSTGFVMRYTTISGSNGDSAAQDEGSVRFLDLHGTNLLDNNDISGGLEDNIRVDNNSGTLTALIISNNNVHDNNAALGNQGILIDVENSPTVSYFIHDNTFSHNRADSVHVGASGGVGSAGALVNVTINDNDFNGERATDLGGGVAVVTGSFNGHLLYDVSGNSFQPTLGNLGVRAGADILVDADAASSAGVTTTLVEGRISNNIIGNGTAFSGAAAGVSAIRVEQHNQGTHTTLVTGNDIQHYGNAGIAMTVGGAGLVGGTFNATVTNNVIHNTDAAGVGATPNGINGTFGTNTGNAEIVNLEISGNTLAGSGANINPGEEDFRLRQRFNSDIFVKGYPGSLDDIAAVVTHVQGQNTGPETGSATNQSTVDTHGWHNLVSVPQPTLPPPSPPPPNPLMAAEAPSGEIAGVGDSVLTQAGLDLIVGAAIDRWATAGASADQLAAMHAVIVDVSDLPGLNLGASSPGHITIDADAAGFNWFIDATPGDDSEFAGSGTLLTAAPDSAADGHMDLLSTVMHELGHQIGLDDDHAPGDSDALMFDTISAGERRLPDAVFEAAGSSTGHVDRPDLGSLHMQLPGPEIVPIHQLDIPAA